MAFDAGSDFPGLYSADNRKTNDSDYSDDGHDKLSKKDLLIGKRKDKKDRGYAALEGESSPEEEFDAKSPSKGRKTNPFKFPSRKEKREKSRDKESKDKDVEKEKDKKKEKDKTKIKIKEKKKIKHSESDISEELPIFGVPLAVAVQRNPCHDGVMIPLVVRNCIDFIELHGLTMEGVYKVSGVKSRVHHISALYNKRQHVSIFDLDLTIASTLLKQFLRSLPDPVLTKELLTKFEDITLTKDTEGLKKLIALLPACNRDLLGWLFIHFKHITLHEKQNKMNASLLSAIFCPSLQVSPRLFNALTAYAEEIFPDIVMSLYMPPLQTVSADVFFTVEELNTELKKQESLLNLIHFEMNLGFVSKEKEEELWGVQRNVTQLKRKLKSLERESRRLSNEIPEPSGGEKEEDNEKVADDSVLDKVNENQTVDAAVSTDESAGVSTNFESSEENIRHSESSEDEELMLQYERVELIVWARELQESIKAEKSKIQQLKNELKAANIDDQSSVNIKSLTECIVTNNCNVDEEDLREYNSLQSLKKNLIKNIVEEKEAILDLKIQIRFAETKKQYEMAQNFFNM